MKKENYKKLNPPLGRLGGKKELRDTLISMFPKHHAYIEPFCGVAWVLLGKPPSEVEAINDIDGHIADLFNVIKCAPLELAVKFTHELCSRRTFDRYLYELKTEKLPPIERAFRFLYLTKVSFGGLGQNFGYSRKHKSKLIVSNIQGSIKLIHERLERVYIENVDFKEMFRRYDSPESLFYADPPYYKVCNKAYPGKFTELDYFALKDAMLNMQGKCVLSLNDHEFTRETFKGFSIHEVQVNYSLNKDTTRKFPELIICNF
jgi:DNA adenine methylase